MTTGIYYSDVFLLHDTGSHPESPARLERVIARLRGAKDLGDVAFMDVEPTTPEAIKEVHAPGYVDRVARLAAGGGGWLDEDTVVSPGSMRAALYAAGAAIDAAVRVATGKLSSAFAATRPPGHHATTGTGMGFCLFNNVALAAHHLLKAGLAERIAIVDFDVHHGNGTQDIFYENPRVLAFSAHQWPLFPGTGHYSETGRGAGEGYTVNVPLPPGVGDDGYGYVMESVVTPLLRRYRPDVLLVPCGYDTHWMDPLANMKATVPGFQRTMRSIKALAEELCEGRIVCTLEGGYDIEALAAGVEATIRALAGSAVQVPDPYGVPSGGSRGKAGVESVVAAVRGLHGL